MDRPGPRIREIAASDLVALIRRRGSWVAAASLLGASIGGAYMLLASSAGRDILAGAGAGLIVGLVAAGWIEWGPRARARWARSAVGLGSGLAAGLIGGLVAFGAGRESPGEDAGGTGLPSPGPGAAAGSAVGPDGLIDQSALRRCLTPELAVDRGSFWGQDEPSRVLRVAVFGDRDVTVPDREWDRPPPSRRVTVFVFPDRRAARRAEQDVRSGFAEVELVERYRNVLVGAKVPPRPEITLPLRRCLGTGE